MESAGRSISIRPLGVAGFARPVSARSATILTMSANVEPLRSLVSKYKTAGPRYTSYPTAVQLGPMAERTYLDRLARAAGRPHEPWSLYIHVPFCQQRCAFCACSVIASPAHDRVAPPYVDALLAELSLLSPHLGERRGLAQLHFGGGTPSYLAPELLRKLGQRVLERFDPTDAMEFSVELDPRVTTPEHLDVLAELGVNRVSVGVQDLDRDVQSLIGRVQPREQTQALIDGCRHRGMGEVNVDLVYGLPGQTVSSLLATARSIVELDADRVALYGYAHVPWIRGNQKTIDESRLPGADARLEMFLAARDAFEDAGYVAIGLDHFAKPHDSLAKADREGRLLRNFMGYTVQAGPDLLGLGVTSIGDVDGALVQNTMKLSRYYRALKHGRLPIERGLERSEPDRLRGRIISDLMCRHRVVKREIEAAFGVDFDDYFGQERERLVGMQADGLVVETPDAVELTELGRPFVRNVAMVFDAYSRAAQPRQHSSTV